MYRIPLEMPPEISAGLVRAEAQRKERNHVWNPLYVDILCYSQKVGHITSDGYTHTRWNFYPLDRKAHRETKNKPFAHVVPQWAREAMTFGDIKTSSDYTDESAARDLAATVNPRRQKLERFALAIAADNRDRLAAAACAVLINEPDEMQLAIDLARLALGMELDKGVKPI